MDHQVVTFYEFKDLTSISDLSGLRAKVREEMQKLGIRGTVILAEEGFNSTVCGRPENVCIFVDRLGSILRTEIRPRSSFVESPPFRRIDVKVKPEIVTLKQTVDMSLGAGTHVSPMEWNELISNKRTLVLDTRNDYEYQTGTFRGAINPKTEKFSELPDLVGKGILNTDHDQVAMFCTGGIRCEKFAPYLKQIGFKNVFQLDGGILRYLEEIPAGESMWEGECFVFDDRVTVDHDLRKGVLPDHSQKGMDKAVANEVQAKMKLGSQGALRKHSS